MSAASTPRSTRFDLPPAPTHSPSTTSDTGLTEWTNRIKAMQRQVDADDEAEQRRLEEEIMRARLARMRRSRTGQSGDFGVGMHGINLSKLQDASVRTADVDQGTSTSSSDKPSSASTVSLPKPAIKQMATGTKPASMSLAAFMGGNASGPRLKRQEPQADASLAYDGRGDHGPVHPIFGRGGIAMPGMTGREAGAAPTSSAPTIEPQSPPGQSAPSTPQVVSSEPHRARTMSTSNVARRYVEKIEQHASSQSSSSKLPSQIARERRQSTPHGNSTELKTAPTPSLTPRLLPQNLIGRAGSPAKSPVVESRPKTPLATDVCSTTTSELHPKTPSSDFRPPKTAPTITETRPKTPSTDYLAKSLADEQRAKTPGMDTTRAKTPVQSSPTLMSFSGTVPWQTPRHLPSPQLPSTSTVPPKSPRLPSPARGSYAPQPQRGMSAALLRPPVNSSMKDPTPSISRLQGRGFVQSMVQASDRITTDTQGSPSSAPRNVFPPTPPAPSIGGSEVREKSARRGSVLDRWTPVMNANGSAPSLLSTSKSATPTKPYTAHASLKSGAGQGQDMPVVKTHDTGRSVRSAVSLPSMPKTPLTKSDGLPAKDVEVKLGSSSTMISYIKPIKTGDDPVIPDVDELGVRASEGTQVVGTGIGTSGGDAHHGAVPRVNAFPGKVKTPRASAPASPSSPGKSLSHPTKDRAKKPRKARFEEARPGDALAAPLSSHPSTIGAVQSMTSCSPGPAFSSSSSTGPARSQSGALAPSGGGKSQTSVTGLEAPPAGTNPPDGYGMRKITDRWTEPTLIGIKHTSSPEPSSHGIAPDVKPSGTTGIVGRRALPGLVDVAVVGPDPSTSEAGCKDEKPKEGRTAVPPSSTRHTRIPSTGNRALVMEVAQALSEAVQQQDKDKDVTGVCVSASAPVPGPAPAPVLSAAPQIPSTGFNGPVVEKRKSSYERYSAIAMPPLAEERTPAVTPANTMSRNVGENAVLGGKVISKSPSPWESLRAAEQHSSLSPSEGAKVHVEHVDPPLLKVDVAALLKADRPTGVFVANPDLRTISVEVLSVVHASTVPVQRDANIFYDGEVLAIVHRAKSRETGLVATKVWCWKGNKCHFSDKEEKKVGDFARRYGTSADVIKQQREPAELVHVLGGQLAIRQGTRAHWSPENTAMHVVRSSDGHVLIDEIDLDIRNLCSGYSYCITILDNVYVWHGCGSVAAERTAALRYALDMAAQGTSVKELVEGENDREDEMFWMVIGDSESYAKADYWRWRHSTVPSEPRCWLVDVTNAETPIRPVPTVFAETVQQESVYIIDCFWEFFVLVGKDARGKRSDITLGINTAMVMAPLVAASKPFSPTIHVLILPTQLPLDMRHAFRNLDEFTLNGGFLPDHMNILSTQEATEHLRTPSWDRSVLKDHTMLPLGLDSSRVPLP